MKDKVKIGVSSCLLGNKVRYDGEHQLQPNIIKLQNEFELVPFCPEMEIGLGVPRPKIQLVQRDQQVVCLDQESYQIDYTPKLIKCCDAQKQWLDQISGYIFKTKSPSCGLTKVKTDIAGSLQPLGQGIFAKRLRQLYPDLPVIEEDEFLIADKAQAFLAKVTAFRKF
ncbi:DUF523 domain-containing protein [Aliikangiella sp. G2MR2-5]|uniref:DUF523 domain-containing protein n=1 Tax=Aliikangiella sp. G2MR2-5 TaxID=2788943 RepID=UPI0018AA4FFF|nr:DUF523 domain-containing protein [Aliikangiella sp. G2MR2-5]